MSETGILGQTLIIFFELYRVLELESTAINEKREHKANGPKFLIRVQAAAAAQATATTAATTIT